MATSPTLTGYRFGPFLLELRSGELTKNGRRIRLQEKPRSLLLAFAERPGEVITRAELHERLWPDDTFVDFEVGLNTAMRKLREALDDDSQSPRYIETVRGRGYRFLMAVESISAANGAPVPAGAAPGQIHLVPAGAAADAGIAARRPSRMRQLLLVAAAALALLLAALAAGLWHWFTRAQAVQAFAGQTTLLVADFDNQTGNPRFDNALKTALNVSLQQSHRLAIYSALQTASALRLMAHNDTDRITAAVGGEICRRQGIHVLVVPGITRTGSAYLVTAQLIDPDSGEVVRSYLERSDGEDRILSALDSISTHLRRDLGESRLQIYRSHQPLPQVTTASLAALEDYADGSRAFSSGHAADAVRLYRAAIAADPGFAMAHAALGYALCSFYFNEPARGEEEFQRALALASRVTGRERQLIQARYAESQGRDEDALRLYQEYLREYPSDAAMEAAYARMLRMHSHLTEAVAADQQALRLDPNDANIHVDLAEAWSELAQWSASIGEFRKAISLDAHVLATGNRTREYGFVLVRAGEDEKAEEVFTAALSTPATYADAERSLAFLDLYRGRYVSARQHLMLALPVSMDPYSVARIHYMLAVVADGEGNRRQQIAQLDRIVAGFDALGQKVLYGSLVGQAYARAGEVAKAKKMLGRIDPLLNSQNDEQVAFFHMLEAEIAAASGGAASAVHLEKPPGPNDNNSAATLTCESLAYVNQRAGNLPEAVHWYEQFLNNGNDRAISWEPQQRTFDSWFALARDYQKQGDVARAKSALDNLLTRWKNADPDLPLLHDAQRLRSELTAGR
jgi:DNA-binding winged helix-turn-helix (wHTH) protein/tetratricopeptide (TPR) repeat protein